ncbi:MAG TPA: GPW/gp25 family protein [Acidimicrobiales bacterium]|nr:GPW/gp25 family protein [Acidimicrobiales bacterium]
MAEEFVGAGIAFPMKFDSTGALALVSDDQEIREAIRLVLGTAYGERPMRPEFGCAIHDMVFAPSNPDTAGRVAYEVRRSLERWEPRIDVESVDVTFDSEDASIMYVAVTYSIRGSNDPRNLVFPFYTIPPEE